MPASDHPASGREPACEETTRENKLLLLAALLRHMPLGCECEILGKLMRFSRHETQDLLDEWHRRGHLNISGEGLFSLAYDPALFLTLENFCRENPLPGDSFASLPGYYAKGEIRALLRKSLCFFHRFLRDKDYLTTRRIYDMVSTTFLKLKIPLDDAQLCRMFVKITYKILIRCHPYPWVLQFSFSLYLKIRGIAFAIDDKHSIATINLSIGYLKVNNFTLKSHFIYINYIKKGLNDAYITNDETLINGFLPFNSFLYYLQGNFLKSINCIYSQYYTKHSNIYKHFNRILYIYASLSAVMLGEYDIAINILEQGQKSALALSRPLDASHCRSMIAHVHMLRNDEHKAIAIINELLESPDFSLYTYTGMWAVRLLAYYHYREGRLAQSYACYHHWMKTSANADIVHFGFLTAHYLLELLAAYHFAGFSPIGQRTLQENLAWSMDSSSLSLRAVALRISSELYASERGWGEPRPREDLAESIRVLRALSTPVELAKSLFLATRMHWATGQDAEARACLQEALDIRERYLQPHLPDHIARYLKEHPSEARQSGLAADIRPGGKQSLPVSMPNKARVDGDSREYFMFRSDNMLQLQAKIELLAARDASVLIQGESGVGKELVARQLYELSGQTGKFVAVNMASIPEDLFESEFYGHEKGSFTGAHSQKPGLLELADGGTLFLDEVGEISARIQVKLLRVLQEKEFIRVGGTKVLRSKFRIVTATNKDLALEVREKRFRENLFYRVNVVSLNIPPLRKRGNDMIFIAEYFLNLFSAQYALPLRKFSRDDIDFLLSYAWPGNVRELKNYIERYVLLSESEHQMERITLMNDKPDRTGAAPDPLFPSLLKNDAKPGWPTMEDIKIRYFEMVYIKKDGVISGAGGVAETLGISKVTAYAWEEKLRLKERYPRRIVV